MPKFYKDAQGNRIAIADGGMGPDDGQSTAISGQVVQGGSGGSKIGVFDAAKAYKAGEQVVHQGLLWEAKVDTTGVPPSLTGKTVLASHEATPTAGGALNSNVIAQRFTPSSAMVLTDVDLGFYPNGVQRTYSSFTVSVRTGVTTSAAGTVLASRTFTNVVASASVVEYRNFAFTSPVNLASGTQYHVVIESGTNLPIHCVSSFSMVGGTIGGIFAGAALGSLTQHTSLNIPFRLNNSIPVNWNELGAGPFTFAQDKTLIPRDTTGGVVFGATAMDYVAPVANATRCFFDKSNGSFRAGYSNDATWNKANRGEFSFAAGRGTTASGQYAVAFGEGAVASGAHSTAFGFATSASGQYALASGQQAQAGAAWTLAHGTSSVAESNGSIALGTRARASRVGAESFSSGASASGNGQITRMTLAAATSTATPRTLFVTPSDTSLVSWGVTAVNVPTVTAGRAMLAEIKVVARRNDNAAQEVMAYTWRALVARGSTGNARIVGTPVTERIDDGTATSAWNVAVSIDTANATYNFLRVDVTGVASSQINWVAGVEMVEMA